MSNVLEDCYLANCLSLHVEEQFQKEAPANMEAENQQCWY